MAGRPPSCLCGTCKKCRNRVKAREAYQALSVEERRALVGRRDQEKVRANDRDRYARDHEHRRAQADAYFATPAGKAARNRAARAWAARNPEKRAAQVAASNALRDGRLQRGACVREGAECSGRIEAHHPDYSKPLDVVWACVPHHDELDLEREEPNVGPCRGAVGSD